MLVIKLNDKEVNVAGTIVSSHPGVGMGVAFEGFVQPDGEAKLKSYIEHLARQPKSQEPSNVFH